MLFRGGPLLLEHCYKKERKKADEGGRGGNMMASGNLMTGVDSIARKALGTEDPISQIPSISSATRITGKDRPMKNYSCQYGCSRSNDSF